MRFYHRCNVIILPRHNAAGSRCMSRKYVNFTDDAIISMEMKRQFRLGKLGSRKVPGLIKIDALRTVYIYIHLHVLGDDMTFFKWALDTPSNVEARCISFVYDGDYSEWRDETCMTSQPYVCQYGKGTEIDFSMSSINVHKLTTHRIMFLIKKHPISDKCSCFS